MDGIGFTFGIGSFISIVAVLVNLLLYGLGAYASESPAQHYHFSLSDLRMPI